MATSVTDLLKCGPPQFGIIVLTTSSGIMDHEEARRKKVGGKVRCLSLCRAHASSFPVEVDSPGVVIHTYLPCLTLLSGFHH